MTTTSTTHRTTQRRDERAGGCGWIRTITVAVALLCCAAAGCRFTSPPSRIESDYGDVQSRGAERTVDGLDVLAEMFERSGHKVRRWRRLSPKLMGKQRRADDPDEEAAYRVIVWAPRSSSWPSRSHYEFLGQWVDEGGTLILIGPDFDPVVEYWRKTLTRYEHPRYPAVLREAMRVRSRHEAELLRRFPLSTPWCRFEFQPGNPRVHKIDGEWSGVVDVAKAELQTSVRMIPWSDDETSDAQQGASRSSEDSGKESEGTSGKAERAKGKKEKTKGDGKKRNEKSPSPAAQFIERMFELGDLRDWPADAAVVLRHPVTDVVLDSDRGPLVLRVTGDTDSPMEEDFSWEDDFLFDASSEGQVLICTNGSFLFNLSMLSPGNRELAQILVDECGAPGRVAIVEPEAWRVRVWESEPTRRHIPPRHEPLATILDHVAFLGVAFCFVFFPIFGRPKERPREPLSDFGEHIDAVAKLMAKTGDADYARRQVEAYQRLVQRGERPSSRSPQGP